MKDSTGAEVSQPSSLQASPGHDSKQSAVNQGMWSPTGEEIEVLPTQNHLPSPESGVAIDMMLEAVDQNMQYNSKNGSCDSNDQFDEQQTDVNNQIIYEMHPQKKKPRQTTTGGTQGYRTETLRIEQLDFGNL